MTSLSFPCWSHDMSILDEREVRRLFLMRNHYYTSSGCGWLKSLIRGLKCKWNLKCCASFLAGGNSIEWQIGRYKLYHIIFTGVNIRLALNTFK